MTALKIQRRTFIGASAALFAPAVVQASTLGGGPKSQHEARLQHGSVTVNDFGDVKIHSYQSPDLTGCVTSQIVETPERLIVVDGQRSVIFGEEVRAYAQSTGKPIDRMIISHLHPDHWFGADRFRDVPIYAFKETRDEIDQLGDFFIKISLASLGKHVPKRKVVPTRTIRHNTLEEVDGVRMEYRYAQDAESDNMMMIYLPLQKVLIAQDMLYNNCHLFCGHGNFDGWMSGLRQLRSDRSYDLILPGHGPNTGSRQAIDDAIVYLEFVKQARASASTATELKSAILERYPSYLAAGLVDIQNLFLFPDG